MKLNIFLVQLLKNKIFLKIFESDFRLTFSLTNCKLSALFVPEFDPPPMKGRLILRSIQDDISMGLKCKKISLLMAAIRHKSKKIRILDLTKFF